MKINILIIFLISFVSIQSLDAQNDSNNLLKRAELLFRSVYEEANPTSIDTLVSPAIVSSYPIFEQIFGKKAIQGKEAYKQFAVRFNSKWKNCQVTIDETIMEGNKVVLVWSFSAQGVSESKSNNDNSVTQSWGGISLFRFNELGLIIEEIGEESSPGPYGRLH